MDRNQEVSVIGHLIYPAPVIGKAERLLVVMGGKDRGPDKKYERYVDGIGEVGTKLTQVQFRGKTYLLRSYEQRDGGTGLSIVKGGTPKTRKDFKTYLRKSLNLKPRQDEKY